MQHKWFNYDGQCLISSNTIRQGKWAKSYEGFTHWDAGTSEITAGGWAPEQFNALEI